MRVVVRELGMCLKPFKVKLKYLAKFHRFFRSRVAAKLIISLNLFHIGYLKLYFFCY